jgi:carbonic anhydrase
VSLVERAVDEGVVTPPLSPRTVRHRLVEYNVVRQVAFLAGRLPSTVTVVGYVHDQDGVYGDFPGRHAVVSVDGHTGTDAIRSRVPDDGTAPVASVLR